ncbi:hypothetical protein B5V03_30440 [Bradyrhizobium betae]|uniref:Uncharacterized protein n=1 Tax=Bradyrhizobium betae TaxID=244734 RepID=A0A4Q1UPF2_9BRAD|nr:hypothetical protein B5V03_30440 [Bradyrhizobium betae]
MRAQRSNPESLRGDSLDCFAALAMTEFVDPSLPGIICQASDQLIRRNSPPVSGAGTDPR